MIYILSCFQMPKNAASASQSHAMQDVSRDRTGSSCNFVPEKSLSICLKKGNDWYDKVVTKNIQKWPGFKEVTLDSKNQVPPICGFLANQLQAHEKRAKVTSTRAGMLRRLVVGMLTRIYSSSLVRVVIFVYILYSYTSHLAPLLRQVKYNCINHPYF